MVADDFGRSAGVNLAIAEGFDRGIVTAASLMASGAAFDDAVSKAIERPRLSIGLHVTLCDGRALLPPSRIPGLVDDRGRFDASPARAGVRYAWHRRRFAPLLAAEIAAQFDRLSTAIPRCSHVDAHHHLHVHPLIFPIVCREAAQRQVAWIRVPTGGARDGRLVEWAVFGMLALLNGRTARRHGLETPARVHGLSRTGRIDEAYLLDLLGRLRPGWNELFVHPDRDTPQGACELQALVSPRVRDRIESLGIVLTHYGPARDGAPAGMQGATS